MALALACWVGLLCPTVQEASLPRELTLDEPVSRRVQDPGQDRFPPAEPARPAAQNRSVVDFDWLELTPSAGLVSYSSKFLADPALAFALHAHVPMPWLNPPSDPIGEYFGLYANVAFTTIDRELSPTVSRRRGVCSFTSLGVDFSFLRDDTWILVARAGVTYAYYGGVADLKSGFGPSAGLSAGIQVSGKLALIYSPEIVLGDTGSHVLFNTLGLLIQF